MQHLRHAVHLSRLVLVWFALSVGVAIASPWVNPKGMEMVCSSAGVMKLVAQGQGDGDAGDTAASLTLDCPLCAATATPPPALNTTLTPPSPQTHVLQPIAAAHIATLTAPPPPSRGPPALFL